ncbi:hypothetical protein BCR33DRAFT_710953 [Rhizoclosmatium globosum]|uniref:Uncharacterized protein n=1 Tax=Rhizoclosmatium globosum TaxID=329046 RepID=A0A1Y2D2W5_9FUNG|nr:hypothetical protein BCR33DRAFT_710953 [Rhizoclosmatium globosum]|eukprot:ORY53547.1 hypothetical protein BCR33DRAFT_710953 [Rhizoclosmatium globosum]
MRRHSHIASLYRESELLEIERYLKLFRAAECTRGDCNKGIVSRQLKRQNTNPINKRKQDSLPSHLARMCCAWKKISRSLRILVELKTDLFE